MFVPDGPFTSTSGDNGAFIMENLPEGDLTLAFFDKALQLDPNLAEAYAGIGAVWAERASQGWEGSRKSIEEVKEYEDKKASLEAKIQLINSLKTNQKGPVRLMDEISKALPDLVWLTNLEVAGNQITMRGKTLSPNAVATYLENLKKSPFFAEPVFKSLGADGGSSGTFTWEMTLGFNPAAALASAPALPAPTPGPEKKGKGV